MDPKFCQTTISVLGLNMWGVPNSTDRVDRRQAIADILETNAAGYDVACLQECYVASDARCLIEAGKRGNLGFAHVFRNGAGCWGSRSPGLVVLSRFPITRARLCRFACSGKVHKLWQMDGIHHKAIGLAVLDCGDMGSVCVYVTHFVAVYRVGPVADEYYAQRLMQAREAARFITDTSADASLVVVCGDLNAEPSHATYKHLVAASGLADTVTPCDTTLATYARRGNPYVADDPARLDYVLWRSTHPVGAWRVTNAGIDAATDERAVSDHAGVFARFTLARGHPAPAVRLQHEPCIARGHNLHLMSALKSAIAECGARTDKHKVLTVSAWVFAFCVYPYAPWLAPLAVALGAAHFVIYGVFCGEEMSGLVQAHNELAIQLGCEQCLEDDMGDAFEFACVVLAMGS